MYKLNDRTEEFKENWEQHYFTSINGERIAYQCRRHVGGPKEKKELKKKEERDILLIHEVKNKNKKWSFNFVLQHVKLIIGSKKKLKKEEGAGTLLIHEMKNNNKKWSFNFVLQHVKVIIGSKIREFVYSNLI